MAEKDKTSVKVVARARPPNYNEVGCEVIVQCDSTGKNITVDGQRKAAFTFDRVFGPDSKQEEVYEFSAKSIVEDVLKGYNGTIFAYGQTASGKTFTMEGPDRRGPLRGLIPRIVDDIFNFMDVAPEFYEFTVKVSYFEIYMERIRDLLSDGNTNLEVHESKEKGVYVRNATELFMQNAEGVMQVFDAGAERRAVAATKMNDYSSRSHSVFVMEVGQKDTVHGGSKTGKLYLVDLAGSEKVSKTGADGEVLEEAKNINKSLSALGLVIMSLTDGNDRQHIPYRDSKLTRILQESLGGNARTTVIINVSPAAANEQETISSLRFGQRAKKIKNNAVMNVQYSAEELQRQLDAAKREIRKLAQRLAAAEQELQIWRSGGTVTEEMRVALGSGDTPTVAAVESESAQPTAYDREKEELLTRENEDLLASVDEKNEQIRILEREIEGLMKEKATFSAIASENMEYQNKVKALEERVGEVAQENTAYELTIEDMARQNNDLEEEMNRIKDDLAQLNKDAENERKKFNQSTKLIADVTSALAVPLKQAGDTLPVTQTGTLVDAQISKVRTFVVQLQNDLFSNKEQKSKLEAHRLETQKAVEDLQRQLNGTKLSLAQTEEKLNVGNQRNAELSHSIAGLERQRDELQSKVTDLLDKMVKNEESMQSMKAQARGEIQSGQAQLSELKKALEAQKETQRLEDMKQLADLRAEIIQTKEERERLIGERDNLQLKLEQLETDLKQQQERSENQIEKLTVLTQMTERDDELLKQTQGLTDATTSQLNAYDSFRARMVANLRSRSSHISKGQPAITPQHAQHLQYLEKMVKDLSASHLEAVRQNTSLQRELASTERQLQGRGERIKNLEQLMNQSEERAERQSQELELLKLQANQARPVARKRPSVVPPPAREYQAPAPAPPPPVVRGGAARLNSKPTPVASPSPVQGTSTPSPSAVSNVIVGQGTPLVGQYAHAQYTPKPIAKEDPADIAFV